MFYTFSPSVPTSRPLMIAHRGLSSKAPENTLSAFTLAEASGVDFIEFDVHLSKDGVPVVIHDPTIERTTNSNQPLMVKNLTVDELQRFDAGSWFSKKFSKEIIPTLDQVLSKFSGRIGIFIEIKNDNEPSGPIIRQIIKVIKAHPTTPDKPILLGSFSHEVIKTLQSIAPTYPLLGVALSVEDAEKHLRQGIKHLAFCKSVITQELIDRWHNEKIVIWSFTVEKPEIVAKLKSWKIDGIISKSADQYL